MKFDLHVHTCNSYDSISSLDSILKYARRKNLKGIAITDHQAFGDNIHKKDDAEQNIWIIPGSEIYTEIGDIIGLFICKPLLSTKAIDLIDEIHDQKGIAILAHPFKRQSYYPIEAIEKIDAIEVVNSRWIDLRLHRVNPKVNQLLSLIKGRSAGSDAHFAFEVGRAYLFTPQITSYAELKKIICNGTDHIDCNCYSRWLDEFSQVIKFKKSPSSRQLARVIFHVIKKITLTRKVNI